MKRLEKDKINRHKSPSFLKHAAAVIFTTLMVESAAAQDLGPAKLGTLKDLGPAGRDSLKIYLPEYFIQDIIQKNTPEKIKNTINYTKAQNMTKEETADYLVGKLMIIENGVQEESISQGDAPQKPESMIDIINEASNIIRTSDFEKRLTNPYIVSALYYSDNFYAKTNIADEPTREIIHAIKNNIDPQFRKNFFQYLTNQSAPTQGEKQSSPLNTKIDFPTDHQMEENHQDAIDIFQEEGSSVKSICSGIVILAQSGWDPNDKLSTSSYLGGNTVIIFDPLTYECYRYAHLQDVYVKTGDLIKHGTEIGTIGHTGKNAQKSGHGNHIHLEINKITPEQTISTDIYTLKQRLQDIENTEITTKK